MRPSAQARRTSRMAAAGLLLAVAALAANGCGPIGVYHLAHSFFDHHHVFRPVMPDEAIDDDGLSQPLPSLNRPVREKRSSGSDTMPMENTRPPIDTTARADRSRALAGDRPCGD